MLDMYKKVGFLTESSRTSPAKTSDLITAVRDMEAICQNTADVKKNNLHHCNRGAELKTIACSLAFLIFYGIYLHPLGMSLCKKSVIFI